MPSNPPYPFKFYFGVLNIETEQLQQQSIIKMLFEIDKKRQALFAKKRFITKEDMKSICDSYRNHIIDNNNNNNNHH